MQDPRAPSSTPVVVFGKAPWMGDFLRIGTPSRTGEALEQWVEQGVMRAESRHGSGWASAYHAGAPYAFIFRSPRALTPREVIVGVVLPSTDSVGRRFPLLAYAAAPPSITQLGWPHVLPIVLGDFLEAAAGALHLVPSFANAADLVEALRPVPAPDWARGESEARDYAAWTAGAKLAQAFAVVYAEAAEAFAHRAIHVLAAAVAPFRGHSFPATTLALRLPLGAGGAAAAAFWLDAVRRLSHLPHEVRTSFWSFDGARGQVIIQLGDTPPGTLAELWAPDAHSEFLCDLTGASNVDTARLQSALPPHIGTALAAQGTLVRDFLDQLVL